MVYSSENESEEDRINYNASESDASDRESDAGERWQENKKKAGADDGGDKLPNLCDYMIDREYRRSWEFQDGIRELVQNTLDGAFAFAEEMLGIESPREIKLLSANVVDRNKPSKKKRKGRSKAAEVIGARQPIVVRKKPPKAIGLEYGYEVLFILVVEKNTPKSSTAVSKNSKATTIKSKYFLKWTNWNENTDAVACIRCLYGTDAEFDIKNDIKEGHLAGSVMYSFEAENKAMNFNIQKILTLGKTSKALSSNQAGKFGEGLKVGAVAMLREGFDLSIQGSGKRCKFHFRKSRMTTEFTLHAKLGKATKRYLDSGIVGAMLVRSNKQFIKSYWSDGHFQTKKRNLGGVKEGFLHEKYRVLCLKEAKENEVLFGKETRCELLLAEHDKGSVFCKAIFVEKKKRLLFGYDLKEAELPMERNHVRDEELRINVGKLLRDVLLGGDLDKSTRKNVLDRILEMLASHYCRDVIEAQVPITSRQ